MFMQGNMEGDEGCGCGGHGPKFHAWHHGGPPHGFGSGWAQGRGVMKRLLGPTILLLLAEKPQHGYELMGKMKEMGVGQGSDPSILYRFLRYLERSGLAESTLDDSGPGPARKVYNLTPEGMEMLDMWAADLEEFSSLLEEFKKRYQDLQGGKKA
jgi:PadR family transcriptional regulator PadR